MENVRSLSCDLHGGDYPTRTEVRGSIGIYGPHISTLFDDVCAGCIDDLASLIRERFPNAHPRVRDEKMVNELVRQEEDGIENWRVEEVTT